MKRIAIFCLSLVLLLACVPTPEEDVVVNKNDGILQQAVYATLLPEQRYEAPGTLHLEAFGADTYQITVDADVIVLSSPVYFYSIDAQLKALIDRTLARWTEVKNKEFYYIVTCADDDTAAQETTLACFRGYADCVKGAEEKGIIYGTGVYQPGEIRNNPACSQAYDMGKSV